MFHAQDGLHFERQEDGSVKVELLNQGGAPSGQPGFPNHGAVLFATTLAPASWASVVASMCSEGETHRTWRIASVFHDSNV